MSDVAINQVSSQMRTMAASARMEGADTTASTVSGAQFSELMSDSINQVNETMQASKALQQRFETGDPTVSLAEVMVTAQKASLQFTALTEVRNKVLNAYQEIMNMPV
jgi:flagellar hook-basal body complex protein FliE